MSGLTRSSFVLSTLLLPTLFGITGCMLLQSDQTYSHKHSHEHAYNYGHSHEHTHSDSSHHGIVVPLFSGQQHKGFAEIKLHDDKGDLELWLTKDKTGGNPFELPLNSEIVVSFQKLDTQAVLRIRNSEQNEDEEGNGNIRDNKTNYFIFPGDTGVDASFLTGKKFSTETVISFEVNGVTYTTNTFKLQPHTH